MISLRERIDVLIRILFGAAIAIGCYFVVSPFLTAITLAAIVTIVSWPLFVRFKNSFGERSTPAALLMVTLLTVCLIIPISFLSAVVAQQLPGAISSIVDSVKEIESPIWLKGIPVIGPWLFDQFAYLFNPKKLTELIQSLMQPMSRLAINLAISAGNGLVQMALVAFIAFFIYRDGDLLARRSQALLERVSGGLSTELSNILVSTTRSVVWGIVGTAAAQSVVACIGFIIVGAPGTLLLSIAVFVLSVVPIGPPLVWGPVAFWLYTQGEIGLAIFMVAWGLLAVASVDNFIKPLLIARGTPLPISLVFLGVFGGVLAFGFLGMILGPVLLAIGVAMIKTWISVKQKPKKPKKTANINLVAPEAAPMGEPQQPKPQKIVTEGSGLKENTVARRNHPRMYPRRSRKS